MVQMPDDDGCCHKTRRRGAPCPLGRVCPYDEGGAVAASRSVPDGFVVSVASVVAQDGVGASEASVEAENMRPVLKSPFCVIGVHDVELAIIAEFKRQSKDVYFWDEADKELFDGGIPESSEFRSHNGDLCRLHDRFDMHLVARAVIKAMDSR